jgi:hypothetical protein
MKRITVTVVAVLLAAGLLAGPALAQGKKVEFSLNAGAMTDLGEGGSFSDVLFTFAPQVDIPIARAFMISPEIMLLMDKTFSFDPVILYPGVILNYTTKGGFFAGAGVVLPVGIGDGEMDTGDLLPKINLGYRGRHVKVTAYLLTNTQQIFQYNLVGLGLGYLF